MLEKLFGNLYVTIAAYLIGPAILYWLYKRRKQEEADADMASGERSSRATPTPKPARAEFADAPDEVLPEARRSLWPGFRGVRWGQPPVTGMQVVHEDGETRFLTRRDDELRIGNVAISSVAYAFYRDRLQSVVIDLPLTSSELLVRYLAGEWGPPRSTIDRVKHVWSDPGTGAEASHAVLEKKAESRSARLVLSSKAINAEKEREKARTQV